MQHPYKPYTDNGGLHVRSRGTLKSIKSSINELHDKGVLNSHVKEAVYVNMLCLSQKKRNTNLFLSFRLHPYILASPLIFFIRKMDATPVIPSSLGL